MTLNEYLKTNNISQRAFAKHAGIRQAAANRYATGTRTPDLAAMQKIIDATGGQVGIKDFLDAGDADPKDAG